MCSCPNRTDDPTLKLALRKHWHFLISPYQASQRRQPTNFGSIPARDTVPCQACPSQSHSPPIPWLTSDGKSATASLTRQQRTNRQRPHFRQQSKTKHKQRLFFFFSSPAGWPRE